MPTDVPGIWQEAAARIAALAEPRIVFVAGSTDTGKTTFCRYLQDELAAGKRGMPAAYLDCDPGQSVIGPPATVGLWMPEESGGGSVWLRFVGSTSPSGHLLQTAVGIRRLQDRAMRERVHSLVVDSSGFVEEAVAREFQFRVIDLLRPRVIVGFEGRSVRALLAGFRRATTVIFLKVDRRVQSKSPETRRAYRRDRFRAYFRGCAEQEISLRNLGFHGMVPSLVSPGQWRDLLCAFCDPARLVLALGIIRGIDLEKKKIRCIAPSFAKERIASIQFGSLYLDPEGQELRRGSG
jgi:polynucleotide 5'-hydroxyl-kinase GRC3/NOL9